MSDKHVALDALDLSLTWMPSAPFQIEGSILIDAIVSTAPERVVYAWVEWAGSRKSQNAGG